MASSIRAFKDELSADPLAARRVELAIITFGPVTVSQDFITADSFQPSELHTQGDTPMGAAIERALSIVESRKQEYRSAGVQYYRPWIFLITDGGPTDSWKTAGGDCTTGDHHKLSGPVDSGVVQLSWHCVVVTFHLLLECLDGAKQRNSMDEYRVTPARDPSDRFQADT